MAQDRKDKKSADYDIAGILEEMRQQYWEGIEEPTEEKPVDTTEYLIFNLGGQPFTIPTPLAREVIRPPHLVQVPGTGDVIAGIINLRGRVIAVTDLCPLLGLARRKKIMEGRLVIVESAGVSTALAVEEVEGIRTFTDEDVEPLSQGAGGLPRETATGQITLDGQLLIILDIEKLLVGEQLIVNQKKT